MGSSNDRNSGNGDGGISIVILAGGRSRRLGQDKAVADFGGDPLLRRVIRRAVAGIVGGDCDGDVATRFGPPPYGGVSGDGDSDGAGNSNGGVAGIGYGCGGSDGGGGGGAVEVVVAVSDAGRAADLPLAPEYRIAVDRFAGAGALGGIYTGLEAAGSDWALVVACDLPFISPPLLRYLAGQRRRDGVDAVVPVIGDRPEPTHALYSRRCLPAIRARLNAGQLKAAGFLDDVAVRYLNETELRRYDPQLLSFFNINCPRDLARARALARELGG